jgi:hypothetical protein
MTVRIAKQPVNIREKLSELERPIGLKGSELMRAETAQEARDFVSAGRKNMVINGDMRIWQRGDTTTSVTGNSYYSADRFRNVTISAGTWTLSKSTTVPIGQGFAASLKYDCTTANASLSAGSLLMLEHRFEGQDMQSLKKGTANAESLTLSFWVRSNKTGTYIAELRDEDNNRTISQSYTIDASDTWEKKILTFAGDTTGALDNDNALSFYASFYLAAGTDYSSGTLSTSWGTRTNVNRAVGQVNLADSTSNEWYITGVQLEVGKNATEFEHRSYGEELALCQRYCYVISQDGNSPFDGYTMLCRGHTYSSSNIYGYMMLPVPMRIPPSFSNLGSNSTPLRWTDWNNSNVTGFTINELYGWNHLGGRIRLDKTSAFTAQRAGLIWFDGALSGQKIAFDAEL